MEAALLLVSIAIAIRSLHRDGLLATQHAAGITAHGAETMVLIDLSNHLEEDAVIADHERRPDGDALRARAVGIGRLAVEVLDAGGWAAVFAAAPDHARETWLALADDLEGTYAVPAAEPVPDGLEVHVDMQARTMHVRMSLRSMIDRWWVGRFFAPGKRFHRWPLVGGRLFGDPRTPDGDQIMMVAVIEDERTALGVNNLHYDLGRPA
ncbi:hypothetical protein [Chenggangzhangella methanolivorans]|uniref:Uncharacterized protein n=1 Tax=Chenggangzhangella methanolivorans TaxID=1437009 RepID=A0A9E6RB66_9HYPH|nr:hypothetical protein [Chenggangzhangella methanolivorans]QZO00630.1 hypothetical protein K6K41_02635 [Chenggangzhangella methanolivorans]